MNKESKLTKYTLIAAAILLIAYFSTDARAGTGNDVAQISAICAAINGMAGELTEQDNLSEIFTDEGKWWYLFLKEWSSSEEIAIKMVKESLRTFQLSWNTGDLSWDDVMDGSGSCLEAKYELIELAEE